MEKRRRSGGSVKLACAGALSLLLGGAWGCTSHTDDGTASGGGTSVPDVDGGVMSGTGGSVAFPPPDGGTCVGGFGPPGFQGMGVPTGVGGSLAPTPLQIANVVKAPSPPPAISGGTLLITADATRLVASDPDRDVVYVIDPTKMTVLATLPLQAGDEPGRLVEDGAGFVHVALRGGRGIASIDPKQGLMLSRTPVCDLPRGIAYDKATDVLHVACAEGKLVTLSATLGTITRTLLLGRDLRDVVMQGSKLLVTRFRSAELLTIDSAGKVASTYTPPALTSQESTFTQTDACGNGTMTTTDVVQTPTVAWRAISVPGQGVAMLHQRSRTGEVSISQGGYGGGDCGGGIVQATLSLDVDKGDGMVFPSLDSMTLPVDVAVDPQAGNCAVVAAGNWGSLQQVSVFNLANVRAQAASMAATTTNDPNNANSPTPMGGAAALIALPTGDGGVSTMPFFPQPGNCMFPMQTFEPQGQATSVAFVSVGVLAVQTREPAGIDFYDLTTGSELEFLSLGGASMADTGHEMFHLRTGAGVACASCHAEAGDDGHVWTFAKIGPRRTQHLRGGILGTEPFHWDGDMTTFDKLMSEVFVGRMSGFPPTADQSSALSSWVDVQPGLKATPADGGAVMRGHDLFASSETGCTSCHAGAKFTNNQNANVGTGAALQVPSLRSVSFRAPFLHDGCAKTLRDRFGACGGGDKHGHTSQLSSTQLDDLVAYLESL